MNDITGKVISLRSARAEGSVYCSPATIERIRSGQLPKGNFFDTVRAAGLLGAKQTQHLLPHCHPVPIDGFQVDFELDAGDSERGRIHIVAEGRSVSRTGIEMEVLTAVSICALTMYDMLKPVDSGLEIGSIRLLKKTGGRSQQQAQRPAGLRAAILVVSDRVAAGQAQDRSGPLAASLLGAHEVEVVETRVVPDEIDQITRSIQAWVAADVPFVFTSGGTGLGPRDRTVEAVQSLLETPVPGIPEAMRRFGQDRTNFAMLARQVAGTVGRTLVVTLPGSTGGVREGLQAILPGILHARAILEGDGHAPGSDHT
jgi:molybdenum cofactor biosynthesis protein MoaC